MRELVDNNDLFFEYAKEKLGDQYFAFEQTIRLIRNILSHTTTSSIILRIEDFVKQRDFLTHEKDPLIKLDFVYADHRNERK